MPNNPFVILGVSENASQSEILDAYKAKRSLLQEHLFDAGEAGDTAARKITELDDAYQRAMEIALERATVSGEGESTFDAVKQAIRAKNPEDAQRALDDISNRSAEWHYYQSVVFYEKNWLNDSKKQLEIALSMEPSNEKYSRALENLKKKIDGSRPYDNNGANDVYHQSTQQGSDGGRTYRQRQRGDAADGCCAACQALWCADCCCECMGGDLIRCC